MRNINAINTAHRRTARRGMVSVMAMVFLVLFSVLAIGAYSAITSSIQVSYNQRDVNAAAAGGVGDGVHPLSALSAQHPA